jgi:hypothetical protein
MHSEGSRFYKKAPKDNLHYTITMRFVNEHEIYISNIVIVDFLKKYPNLMTTCENVIENLCLSIETSLAMKPTHDASNRDMSNQDTSNRDMSQQTETDDKTTYDNENQTICSIIDHFGGSLDIFKQSLDDMNRSNSVYFNALLTKAPPVMLKEKGQIGEDTLIENLSQVLMFRDGFSIEKVSGISCSCDILVKKQGMPDIRIESKAHEHKVRQKEVEKFVRDLMNVNNHGIFVSLHSGIVGVNNFEIQHLSNGKFAIYLANNDYDTDTITDMIRLLYKLDELTSTTTPEDEEGIIKVPVRVMTRVKQYMSDYSKKIYNAKGHLKESLAILSEVQMDLLEKTLLCNMDADACANAGAKDSDCHYSQRPTQTCEYCNKSFKTDKGLRNHKCSARSS